MCGVISKLYLVMEAMWPSFFAKYVCCTTAMHALRSYWTMITMEEADLMASFDKEGADPGCKGGLKMVRQLFAGITQLAADDDGIDVNILMPYNINNLHHVLLHLKVHPGLHVGEGDDECTVVEVDVYDSCYPAGDVTANPYILHVVHSFLTWNEWFAKEGIKLKINDYKWAYLSQQQCTWRCGYFVVLNASRLMRGQRKLQLANAGVAGALDAAAVDVYTSLVKRYNLRTKSLLTAAE